MASSIFSPQKRAFAAGFFAVVALGTAALLAPLLGLSLSLTIALSILAAAFAYGWAWLLCPRGDAAVYGASRGAVVALLSYLSLMALMAASRRLEAAGFMLVGFVWTPFPWLVLAAGAAVGGANLSNVRWRIHAWVTFVRRVWIACVAVLRATYERLDEWATDPRSHAVVTTIVSSCLLFAGGVLGLAWFPPGHAFSDAGIGASQRLLPALAALILAVAGRACGRVLLAIMSAAHRLHIALMSAVLAVVAAVWFSTNVVA